MSPHLSADTPAPPGPDTPASEPEQRIVMYNVSWQAFEAQLSLRGDAPLPRMAYLDGMMELRSPSRNHERLKSFIGRLVEAYALASNLDLSPYGAWTLRRAPKAAGLEPDECYIIGSDQSADRPDLAIEVTWTHCRIDKLEIYRRLEVPEVWIWQEGRIAVHVLRGAHYEATGRSAQLPGLDLDTLVSFLEYPTAMQAVRAYRETLG